MGMVEKIKGRLAIQNKFGKSLPDAAIFIVAVGLTASYLGNSTTAYDDLYLPQKFSGLTAAFGYVTAFMHIFFGFDLPTEYRTYGLSRGLQYSLWVLGGAQSQIYPFWIALTQLASALLLLRLARRSGLDDTTGLMIALVWLLSPFATTWCFHHYSYFILPFQLLVASCYVLSSPVRNASYLFVAALGVISALTGETQLIAVPTVIFLLAIFSDNRKMRVGRAMVFLAAMMVALVLHYAMWRFQAADLEHSHRFSVAPFSLQHQLELLRSAVLSIFPAAIDQLRQISENGYRAGVASAAIVGALFWFASGSRLPAAEDLENERIAKRRRLASCIILTVVAIAPLLVYLTLEVSTGRVGGMTRRYGFIPFTASVLAATLSISAFVNSSSARRHLFAVVVAITAFYAGQLHLSYIPAARANDQSIVNRLKEESVVPTAKHLAVYVEADEAYKGGSPNGGTLGPLQGPRGSSWLTESPFAFYWTTYAYCRYILGFMSVGIPLDGGPSGHVLLGGSMERPGAEPVSIPSEMVVVLASLTAVESDRRIQVFPKYDNFKASVTTLKIDRQPMVDGNGSSGEELAIDLGAKQLRSDSVGLLPDKKYSDQFPLPRIVLWIENYGQTAGDDTVYDNANIGRHLSYYATNRYGAFSYTVKFTDAISVRLKFDFWEQWLRNPGERVFSLQVSSDEGEWEALGDIDPSALGGASPFFVEIQKSNIKQFSFRLVPKKGSLDVPMMQGVRISRVQRKS